MTRYGFHSYSGKSNKVGSPTIGLEKRLNKTGLLLDRLFFV